MEWCQPVMVKSELSCRFKCQSIFLANLWLKMRSGHLLSELLRSHKEGVQGQNKDMLEIVHLLAVLEAFQCPPRRTEKVAGDRVSWASLKINKT